MPKIVVCHCNRPDFLKLQIESYFKMCKDLEEIIVINDGATPLIRKEIEDVSSRSTKVRCINAPLLIDHSSAPTACASVLQWAYDEILNSGEKGKFAFLDADMFPLGEFKISDYLTSDKTFTVLKQERGPIDYPWNGIFFIDFDNIKNPRAIDWNCGVVKGFNVDCGGLTHLYFEKFGKDHVRFLTHTSHMSKAQVENLKFCPGDISKLYDVDYKLEVIEEIFLHYGSASNWQTSWLSPVDFKKHKTHYVLQWLRSVGAIT